MSVHPKFPKESISRGEIGWSKCKYVVQHGAYHGGFVANLSCAMGRCRTNPGVEKCVLSRTPVDVIVDHYQNDCN